MQQLKLRFGLAAKRVFFIKALGQVGFCVDGSINWDIAALVGAFD